MGDDMIKGYKGFDKDLRCKGFQFEVGGEYEEKRAVLCREGFHFCKEPFDVFGYYPPADSRYAEVEGDGKMDKHEDDSKVVCTKLRVKAEIGLKGMIEAGAKAILERVKWDEMKGSNTGTDDRSTATNAGYQSAATNTGYRSTAINTGDRSVAASTGYRSTATVEGKESVAMAIGYENKAKGSLGCWIVLAEWEKRDDEYHIKDVRCARVDGEKIRPDTLYRLVNGEFVEVE